MLKDLKESITKREMETRKTNQMELLAVKNVTSEMKRKKKKEKCKGKISVKLKTQQ